MRKRVLAAVDELDFQFSEIGRSLQRSTTRTIGCVVPSIENPVYADAVQGAQEVFLNVYRYSSSFKERAGGFRGWCLTIARNVISRKAREHLRRAMLPLVDGSDPADSSQGPREQSITQEEALSFRRAWRTYLLAYAAAFRELKPRDQEALRLVEVEGLAYKEAADCLGVGLSNMKMILLRARRRIWRRMGEWGGSEARAAG